MIRSSFCTAVVFLVVSAGSINAQEPAQREVAREALFVGKVEAGSGPGFRLNKALFDNTVSSLRGDAEIAAMVRSLHGSLGEPYRSALDAVLSVLGLTLAVPVQQAGAQVTENRGEVTEARVRELIAEALATQPRDTGRATYVPGRVNGDLIVTGKVCVTETGRCHPDANAQLQILGNVDATALFVSNINGKQYQNPSAHVAQKSLAADGGFRDVQNGYTSTRTTPAYDPVANLHYQSSLVQFADPTREYTAIGTDSRGAFCMVMQKPGVAHEYTQDLCFRTSEEQKVLSIESWRPGWTFRFGTSTGYRTIDRWFTVPTQP